MSNSTFVLFEELILVLCAIWRVRQNLPDINLFTGGAGTVYRLLYDSGGISYETTGKVDL